MSRAFREPYMTGRSPAADVAMVRRRAGLPAYAPFPVRRRGQGTLKVDVPSCPVLVFHCEKLTASPLKFAK